MNFDFSFLMPGIRTQNWVDVYNAFKKASKTLNTEIVFVGPHPLPGELEGKEDIQYIEDWGSPNRAMQIALLNARGKYCFAGSDDGFFYEGGLDHAFETLRTLGEESPYNVCVSKYKEGAGNGMDEDWYYYLNNHGMTAPGIQNDWMLGCYMLMQTQHLIKEFGGFNMMFEGCAMACQELAVRVQLTGKYRFVLSRKQIVWCTHLPCLEGDHAPMHYAQVMNDEVLYKQHIPTLKKDRVRVGENDWVRTPHIWGRRFGNIEKNICFVRVNDQLRVNYGH